MTKKRTVSTPKKVMDADDYLISDEPEKPLRESDVENYLYSQTRKRGGNAWKWSSPSNRGVMDRITCMIKCNWPVFTEMKAPGESRTPLQDQKRKDMLRCKELVVTIDTKEKCSALLDMMESESFNADKAKAQELLFALEDGLIV